jgi:hypothetical protein
MNRKFFLVLACAIAFAGFTTGIDARAASRTVTIWDDIAEDTTLRAGHVYLIDGEVHVLEGVRLTIEDGVTILIKNGQIQRRTLNRRALILDQGSQLDAKRFSVRAAGADGRPEKLADNGGIWFLGTNQDAESDGVSVTVNRHSVPSRFVATEIHVTDLGSGDPTPSPRRLNPRGEDTDGLSVLGVARTEWKIKSIISEYLADDGFNITNSEIELESLSVLSPFEDGLNVSSSRVRIQRSLLIDMTANTTIPDRDIFDLEVDDGPSYVTLAQGARVKLDGVLGDEIMIRSADFPLENRTGPEHFHFDGRLRKGPASIYSRDQD